MRANFATFANALCHHNATPLSVAVLAPCVWGEKLACGVAWQSMLLGRNGVWQSIVNLAKHNTAWRSEFGNETAQRGKIQWHSKATNSVWQVFVGKTMHGDTANSAWQVWRKWTVLVGKASKKKMGQCLGGDFSLSLSLSLSLSRCSHFLARLWAKLKGFFTHFVVVSSYLVINFSYFIVVLTHLFAYKRHFLGHCAFVKFLNALFLGFLRSSSQAIFTKTAWQAINLALFLLFGLPRSLCSLAMTAHFVILSLLQKGDQAACKAQAAAKKSIKIKENLPFLDTSLALSMTSILRYFTLLRKVQYDKDFVILSLCKRRKIHTLKCKFALQIYGYFATISMTSILRLSPSLKFNTQSLQILCYNFILKDKNAKI